MPFLINEACFILCWPIYVGCVSFLLLSPWYTIGYKHFLGSAEVPLFNSTLTGAQDGLDLLLLTVAICHCQQHKLAYIYYVLLKVRLVFFYEFQQYAGNKL